MDERIKDFGRLIKQIDEVLACRMNRELQSKDLTASQMNVLVTLCHAPGETMTLKELESAFHMAQSTIASMAVRLEKKGLVDRTSDLADRRVKHIGLTDKGRQVCRDGYCHMLETERLLTSRLTGEEMQELHRLLQLVYDAIQ